jgi:signal peptidase II
VPLFVFIAGLTTLLDQFSKQWIKRYVESHGMGMHSSLTSGNNLLDITYAVNTGAAFSIFPNQKYLFIVITLSALIGILFYYFKAKEDSKLFTVGLSLIFGGACGNLIDRVLYGYVIDFLDLHWKDVYHWPTFNIADSAICTGVGLLMLYLFMHQEETKPV